jgi:hypothetical protein
MLIRHNHGDGEVKHIGDQIHLGAMVFMQREYKMLAMFAAVLLLGIFVSPWARTRPSPSRPGAVSSALAGFLGMFAATKANVRTTVAAHNHGQAGGAVTVAFYGGSIMGLCVASLGLLGLGTLYYYFGGDPETAHAIHGFGMGASVVRCSRASAAASSPRAPTSAPTWWARSRRASRGRPAQPRRHRRQRRRQRRRHRRHGLGYLRVLLRLHDRLYRHRLDHDGIDPQAEMR